MKIDLKSLKLYLVGYGVPRHIVRQVLMEFYPLCKLATHEVYQMKDDLKLRLKEIAKSDETLTIKQRLFVERSSYVLKGNSTTRNQQLAGDIAAIEQAPSSTWEAMWPTFVKGARGFGKVDKLRLDAIQPIYQSLWDKYAGLKECRSIEDKEQQVAYIVKKSVNRFAVEVQQWIKLPSELKRSPMWDHVFSGIHLILVEDSGTGTDLVGNIGVDQEAGFKTRLSASPYLLFQCALQPLQQRLQDIVANIPQDCHKDQDSGVIWAQNQLLAGKTLSSYDLSKATHRFPWGVQLKILQHMNVPKAVLDLYTYVSKGSFRFGQEVISWKAGQPLGTNPSFFTFSLAHHALLLGICADLCVDNDCYRILGDDVVISDTKVAARYKIMMAKMGNVINETKSYEFSAIEAEFAGAYITPTEFVRTGKMRSIKKSNQFILQKNFTNRDSISSSVKEQQQVLADFEQFSPLETSNMIAVVHRYMELQYANSVARNLSIPETVTLWDFAATVCSAHPNHVTEPRQHFYNYYIVKMDKLGSELLSYTRSFRTPMTEDGLMVIRRQSEWEANTPSPASLIITSVKELLLELAECPTQCVHLWARALLIKRGIPYDATLEIKSQFGKVSRTLIQLATAYRLTKPAAWMADTDQFVKKLVKWHKQAIALDTKDELMQTVLGLEDKEYAMRSSNLTNSTVGPILNENGSADGHRDKLFEFENVIAIW